jgi:hypothetical protein
MSENNPVLNVTRYALNSIYVIVTIKKKNMKKNIGPTTGVFLISLLLLFSGTSKAQNSDVNTFAFNSEPLIDGIVDEGWAVNEFLEIAHLLTPEKISEENFSGKFKISWYDNNLYFLFVVTDDILVLHKNQPIWQGDNINLYLDLGNEKQPSYDNNDYLYHFKWGNADYYERLDGGNGLNQIENSSSGIEFAQICDTMNHTFVMEIAIRNLAELNGPADLNESTSIGLDAGLYDCDDRGPFSNMYTNHLSWVDTTGYAWSDPSKLGTAGFANITFKSTQISNGMESLNEVRDAKVYPTRVSNSVTIQTTENENLRVEVMNLLGIKIESLVLESGNTRIDVSFLKSGVYFVNIYNARGLLISAQKILKIAD